MCNVIDSRLFTTIASPTGQRLSNPCQGLESFSPFDFPGAQPYFSTMKRPFSRIAAVIFALVAIAHLSRLIFHFSITVAGYPVPLWLNAAGVLIAGALSVLLFRESRM